ncbi:MAG: membrane protein insertase YidC [Candidatus Krumholzibacteria bacterium]|nr:membrane protein insertase YidC [Candidatus Krumholzibacteria bacterium]
MDKRTIIAVLLTFVVLLGYQMFYVAPKQKEIARKNAAEQAIADSIETIEPREEAAETQTEPSPSEEIKETVGAGREQAQANEITVTTSTMRVLLSSIGGDVKQVELIGYERPDGNPVALMPEESSGGFRISTLRDGRWDSHDDAGYTVYVNGRAAEQQEEIVVREEGQEAVVAFLIRDEAGGYLEKRFTFMVDGYEVVLDIEVRREGWLKDTDAYAVGWEGGMAVNEKDVQGDVRQFASLGTVGEEYYQEPVRKFSKKKEKIHEGGMVIWAGARTKYFLSALIPQVPRSSSLLMFGKKSENYVGYAVRYPFRGDPRVVEDSFVCYLGPLDMNTLKAYGIGLEKTIDLGRLRIASVLALRFMLMLKKAIPNYGLIIIIMSILTKVVFYRLTHKSFKSMKDMQKLQPKIKELQEKHKNDKEKLNKATMKLYKEAGVNPLGGCLPLLLQMPVFIALFNVLRNTIELRNAPFMLWINDLSSPDVLFSFGASIPFIGSEFHLLPLLMGGLMVLQTKLGASPTGGASPPGQAKMMSTMMPVVLTVVFYRMPAGLVLYWIVNNILTIVQQYYVHREVEKEEHEAAAEDTSA